MPSSQRRIVIVIACALALGLAPAVSAEIYKWTDASGRMHFTHDLSKVPAKHRRKAEAAAAKPRSENRIQTYSPAAPSVRKSQQRKQPTAAGGGRTHRIRVDRAGGVMRVNVKINDRLDVPFMIDTGASDVVLPLWAAEELGLQLDDARTERYSTANGIITAKKMVLDSVALGGARVEDVSASISGSMREGLLGITFFNHFNYNVDPGRGLVTLTENELVEQGTIRGGRGEQGWRGEYARLRGRIAAMERDRDSTPTSHGRERKRLEGEIEELERQLEVLESEADDARVPFSWRE